MATLLPQLPRGSYKWSYIGAFLDLNPTEGGETTRIEKLGTRFQLETSVRLRGGQGIGLIALLNANKGKKVRLRFPQPGIEIGNPGSPSVAAASDGNTLNLKGLTASYRLQAGQMLTVVKGAKRYLHQITSEVIATGGGAATVTVTPIIRSPLLGNEVVEIAIPTIEGYLQTNTTEWVSDFLNTVAVTVTVKEAE